MPIRNEYGPLRSAGTGTVMRLPTDAIAIRPVLQALEHVADGCAHVDWNKTSADSLSPWRVITAGG